MSEQQTPDGAEGAARPAPGGATEPDAARPDATLQASLPPGAQMVAVPPRRSPRFGRFIVSGVLIGIAVAVVALLLRHPPSVEGAAASSGLGLVPHATDVSLRAALGYLGAVGGLLGGVLGALAAVLVDRRIERQRARDAGMGD